MSDYTRPKPFQPRGAIDGAVLDANMAKNMSFCMRYGNSCGTPFIVKTFIKKHKQWGHLEPYLMDRPKQPWTMFYTKKNSNKREKTIKKTSKKEKTMKRRKH
jgi:hypothetical protein